MVNLSGLKGLLATAFGVVGLWGITTHVADVLVVYIVWLIVGIVLAVL